MEKYITELLAQIRCKRAHELVKSEIEAHMEEQIRENLAMGMTGKEAEEAAVKDMGDPVETGVALDAIHRPQMEWNMVALVAIISVLGLVLQYFLLEFVPYYNANQIISRIFDVALGLLLMLIVYKLDYSLLGSYAKRLELVLFVIMAFAMMFFTWQTNGRKTHLHFGPISVMTEILLYLFVPIFAGVLYQYRGGKYKEIFKCILWMSLPSFLAAGIPSIMTGIFLYWMLSVLLSLAVIKGWFRVAKKKFLLIYWSVVLMLSAGVMSVGFYSGNVASEDILVSEIVAKIIGGSKWFGSVDTELLRELPSTVNTYMLSAVAGYYGIVVTGVMVAFLTLVIGKVFLLAHKEKNQLGMMVGYSCGLVFAMMLLSNILTNLGFNLWSCGDLPFVSVSGSSTLISYILMGLVLSIYRYKNILSSKAGKVKKFRIRIEEV